MYVYVDTVQINTILGDKLIKAAQQYHFQSRVLHAVYSNLGTIVLKVIKVSLMPILTVLTNMSNIETIFGISYTGFLSKRI